MNNVEHPSHYNLPGRKECIVEMEEKFGLCATATFCLMNSYKYLYRTGEKEGNSGDQDVAKARWYFDWVTRRAKELNDKSPGEQLYNLQFLYHTIKEALK